MSTKRQPSKQRRQAENQRQRAALEARRANAAAVPAPDSKVGGGGSSTASSSGISSVLSPVLSRFRRSGAATSGAAPARTVSTGAAAGGTPVGHRAALSGMLAGIAAAVVGAILIMVPVDGAGDPIGSPGDAVGEWSLSAWSAIQENPDLTTADEVVDAVDDWSPNGEQRYSQAYFPFSLTLLLPVIGAAVAFRAVSRRASAKVINRAMYVTLFGTLLAGQLLLMFLPTVIGIGIAAFQVRKAELEATAASAPDPEDDDGDGDGDDDVIEVDEVEAEELAEDDSFLEAEGSAEDEPPATGLARLRRGRPAS